MTSNTLNIKLTTDTVTAATKAMVARHRKANEVLTSQIVLTLVVRNGDTGKSRDAFMNSILGPKLAQPIPPDVKTVRTEDETLTAQAAYDAKMKAFRENKAERNSFSGYFRLGNYLYRQHGENIRNMLFHLDNPAVSLASERTGWFLFKSHRKGPETLHNDPDAFTGYASYNEAWRAMEAGINRKDRTEADKRASKLKALHTALGLLELTETEANELTVSVAKAKARKLSDKGQLTPAALAALAELADGERVVPLPTGSGNVDMPDEAARAEDAAAVTAQFDEICALEELAEQVKERLAA